MTDNHCDLEVLDPRATAHGDISIAKAARLTDLDGKTIGLVWNGKALGDVALKLAAEKIKDKFPQTTFRFYNGGMPCPPGLLEQVAEECDAALGCTADCGSCSSWITHDMVKLERMGLPTVVIASGGFEHDVEASSRAFGMPNPHYVVVPKVYNNLDEASAIEQTEPVVGDIIDQLLGAGEVPAALAAHGTRVEVNETLAFGGPSYQDAFEQFNEEYLNEDWGDGFPLWAPTRERVEALVRGVEGRADDVVCLLPPGNGVATVQKVAVNAAMAGCKPEEMPVIMAALRAIANIRPVPRSGLMSTSAHAPLVLVNGPEAKALGINGARACLGPGRQNRVNLRIGRAVTLCLKNLGSWYPGIMDLDSIGTPRKNIVVVAENEDESPWEPYHVTRGFGADQSTATVFFTSGEWDVGIQGHTSAEQLAHAIASFSGGNSGPGYFSSLPPASADGYAVSGRLLFIPPPHAIPLAEGGYTKRGLEKFMFHQGHESIYRLTKPVEKIFSDGKVKREWEWVFELDDEQKRRQTLPVIERAELYSIVVVGSVRAKDLLMPTCTEPFTEPITATPAR